MFAGEEGKWATPSFISWFLRFLLAPPLLPSLSFSLFPHFSIILTSSGGGGQKIGRYFIPKTLQVKGVEKTC